MSQSEFLKLLNHHFFSQFGERFDHENCGVFSIDPRGETIDGVQINVLTPDQNLKFRIYWTEYTYPGEWGKFKLETLNNIASEGLQDEVYVAICRLPKLFIRLIDVEEPVIQDRGFESQPLVLSSSTIDFATTALYPTRGNELFSSEGFADLSSLINTIVRHYVRDDDGLFGHDMITANLNLVSLSVIGVLYQIFYRGDSGLEGEDAMQGIGTFNSYILLEVLLDIIYRGDSGLEGEDAMQGIGTFITYALTEIVVSLFYRGDSGLEGEDAMQGIGTFNSYTLG